MGGGGLDVDLDFRLLDRNGRWVLLVDFRLLFAKLQSLLCYVNAVVAVVAIGGSDGSLGVRCASLCGNVLGSGLRVTVLFSFW
jgi:hypothetical protein